MEPKVSVPEEGSSSLPMRQMLVIEDERDICDCLQQFFSRRGFEVVSAFSGEEAIARLATGTPDVVLLDILLPGLTGIEILKRIKQLAPHARVVIITALDRVDLREQAMRYGAAAYITKPFDFTDAAWSVVLR